MKKVIGSFSLTAVRPIQWLADQSRGASRPNSKNPPGFPLRLGLVVLAILASVTAPAVGGTGTFVLTGAMTTNRFWHTATLLPNGKVLVAGGYDDMSAFSTAELYDPTVGTWTTTGAMTNNRLGHTATLLPSGKVLVAGGKYRSGYNYVVLSTAELYDPTTGMWTTTGTMTTAHDDGHTATLLPNGKVLVAGGGYYHSTNDWGAFSGAELYDPASGTWTATGSLNVGRYDHTATLLPNGRVLVAGGWNGYDLSSAEQYDPSSGIWTATGSMTNRRAGHTATLLPSGTVLVAGGNYGSALSEAELYDPPTGTWTTAPRMPAPRQGHTATLLPNGKVLIAAGYDQYYGLFSSTELYDPSGATWTATGSMTNGREYHTATLLPDGNVLVAGGWGGSSVLSSAELYDIGLGFSITTPPGTLPPGLVGVTYNQKLTATGGAPPYTWLVLTNSLPAGLSLIASSGMITGTPTVAITADFTVQVTDTNALSATQPFSLTINAAGLWSGAVDLDNGWKWLEWFGYFDTKANPWIYHQQHGWLYAVGSDTSSIFFWDPAMQGGTWWWTSASVYPYLYRYSDSAWLWYQKGSTGPRWFYNLTAETWESW